MNNQKKLWNNEYNKVKGLPSSKIKNNKYSHTESFVKSLKENNMISGPILDIGCGLGKDSSYFSSLGYDAYGFDISDEAIKKAKEMFNRDRKNAIKFKVLDGTNSWKYKDNFFIGSFDGTTFINFTLEKDVNHYLSEASRVTKKNGYIMIVTPILPDEYYLSLLKEQSSKIIRNDLGLYQKIYEKEEILSLLKNYFYIEEITEIKKTNQMFGKDYKRTQLRILCKNKK